MKRIIYVFIFLFLISLVSADQFNGFYLTVTDTNTRLNITSNVEIEAIEWDNSTINITNILLENVSVFRNNALLISNTGQTLNYSWSDGAFYQIKIDDTPLTPSESCNTAVNDFVTGLAQFGQLMGLMIIVIVGSFAMGGLDGKAIQPLLDRFSIDGKALVVVGFVVGIGVLILSTLAGNC